MRTHPAQALGALLLALSVLAACSDSDSSADTSTISPSAAAACETDVLLTNSATGEARLTRGGAVSLGSSGAAYTLYAADYDLDMSTVGLATSPEVAPDGNLATVALTVFNAEQTPPPLEVGAVVPASADFGTQVYVVAHQHGEDYFGNNSGISGDLLVKEVGERICVEVDYRDEEKTLVGTIGADVIGLG